MKALIPLSIFALILLTGLTGFYFVSPAGQVSALQTENNMLRQQIATLQSDNETELVATVVAGMLALTVILLAGFFLVLCLLANKSPAEFFRVPACPALPQKEIIPEIPADTMPETVYYHSDNYAMDSLEVIR